MGTIYLVRRNIQRRVLDISTVEIFLNYGSTEVARRLRSKFPSVSRK